MPVVLVVIAPQKLIALLEIRLNWCRPFKVKVIMDERVESVVGDVQMGKLERFPLSLCCSLELFWFLLWLHFCSSCPFVAGLLFWAVIITVWEAAQLLSSSVEYLSAHLYSSSIVTRVSKDSGWKKGVVGLKLLRKF